MMTVKTKLGISKIHGIGLFADQFIPKGTIVWEFTPKLDIELSEELLVRLPKMAMEYYKKHCYRSPKTGKYILCFDDTKFINHSENPNCADIANLMEESPDIALRDIEPEEEITLDYRIIDADWEYKMNRKD